MDKEGNCMSMPPAMREYYDGVSKEGRELLPEEYQEILSNWLLGLKRKCEAPVRIADLACGQGEAADFFEQKDCPTLRLDISAKSLQKQAGSRVLADLSALPLVDNSMAGVHIKDAIVHLSSEQRQSFFERISRVLRPGGELLVSSVNMVDKRHRSGGFFVDDSQPENKHLHFASLGERDEIIAGASTTLSPPYYFFHIEELIVAARNGDLKLKKQQTWRSKKKTWYSSPMTPFHVLIFEKAN